jgi:hypothetical protein
MPGSRPRGARRPSHAGAFHVIFLWLLAFASLALGAALFFAPRAPIAVDAVSMSPDQSAPEDEEEGEEEERTGHGSDGLAGDFDGHPGQTWLHGPRAYLVNGWPVILPRAHTSVDLEQEGKPPRA